MKHVTVNTYRQDKFYPWVVRSVARILSRSDVVAPVDVLVEMGVLTAESLEGWRRRLQFSFSGEAGLERAYSTHFLWNRAQDKKPLVGRSGDGADGDVYFPASSFRNANELKVFCDEAL